MSGVAAYKRVIAELNFLPKCVELTKQFCEYQSGILIIDGKYIKVRGYKQKIPFIYGIDYLSHDILFGILSTAEDEKTFLSFFQILKELNYPLQIVVADDRSSLPLALKQVFPDIQVQLCQNHYLENIRQLLHIRTDQTHRHFFNLLKKHLFDNYENNEKLDSEIKYIFNKEGQTHLFRNTILKEIIRRRQELFAYKSIADCPNNTNLIELFNSHFNARFKCFKGFKTKTHAELILNGMMIRRRTKDFTDCGKKFKHLNGKCSLQMSIKKQTKWPDILGVKSPQKAPES